MDDRIVCYYIQLLGKMKSLPYIAQTASFTIAKQALHKKPIAFKICKNTAFLLKQGQNVQGYHIRANDTPDFKLFLSFLTTKLDTLII